MNTLKKLYEHKTQKELAAMIGVSQPTVCDWLKGETKPKPWHCKKIAKIAGQPFLSVLAEFYQ